MHALLGIAAVFAAIVGGFLLEKGNLWVLLQPAELLIVGGAALGIVMVANPPAVIRKMGRGWLAAFHFFNASAWAFHSLSCRRLSSSSRLASSSICRRNFARTLSSGRVAGAAEGNSPVSGSVRFQDGATIIMVALIKSETSPFAGGSWICRGGNSASAMGTSSYRLEAVGVPAVPTATAQRVAGGEDPRAVHGAGVDRAAQREVGVAALADQPDGRDTRTQRGARVAGHEQHQLGQVRPVDGLLQVTGQAQAQVHVHVHQAGQDAVAGQVDHKRLARLGQHALVEREPRELAIEIKRRIRQISRRRRVPEFTAHVAGRYRGHEQRVVTFL